LLKKNKWFPAKNSVPFMKKKIRKAHFKKKRFKIQIYISLNAPHFLTVIVHERHLSLISLFYQERFDTCQTGCPFSWIYQYLRLPSQEAVTGYISLQLFPILVLDLIRLFKYSDPTVKISWSISRV